MRPSSGTGKPITTRWVGHGLLAILAWSAVGLLFALPSMAGNNAWRQPLLSSLSQWWSWGLLTPLIVATDKRFPFSEKQLPYRLAAHLIPSLLLTAAYIYLFAAVRAFVGIGSWSALLNTQILAGALRGMFLWSWLVYWLIIGGWQVYQYNKRFLSAELRMERLERQFSEARLNALRMQLDPHFLFNALNTISSQVERDPKLARRMIGHLGDLLRLSLESRDRREVPLAEEMAFLEHYLAIQKIRFGDHLHVELDIATGVKFASVPCLIIQPLVENAIRHGISHRASGGTVVVSARNIDHLLQIRVLDDGIGLPAGWRIETSCGLGLAVTRERIAGLQPEGYSQFAVRRRPTGGTEVEISLPLRLLKQDSHDPAAA